MWFGRNKTEKTIGEQVRAHGVEFGNKYRDKSSGFEGMVAAVHIYEHGCMRVTLRGQNKMSGEPGEYSFDAPDLIAVVDEKPVPAGPRIGGPHGLKGPSRTGI